MEFYYLIHTSRSNRLTIVSIVSRLQKVQSRNRVSSPDSGKRFCFSAEP